MHCTGSILAPKLILTAAHCFAKESDNYIPKEKLRIVYGLENLKSLNYEYIPKEIRKIKEVLTHPLYQWQRAYSDIVILKVHKSITFSTTIYPVCIPGKDY